MHQRWGDTRQFVHQGDPSHVPSTPRISGRFVFDLPLTREEMADYLGLTLETVSRQITALKKDGLIELEGNRNVTIPDFDALLDQTGDDNDGGFLV